MMREPYKIIQDLHETVHMGVQSGHMNPTQNTPRLVAAVWVLSMRPTAFELKAAENTKP